MSVFGRFRSLAVTWMRIYSGVHHERTYSKAEVVSCSYGSSHLNCNVI